MNERIKDLVDKAKKAVPHGLTPDKWIETYNEKFAELIVRECADVSNRAEKQCQHPGTMIKKHFGVEE